MRLSQSAMDTDKADWADFYGFYLRSIGDF